MSHLSRRDFLKCAGVMVVASAVAHLPAFPPAPSINSLHGRALKSLPVYAAPSERAALKSRLWADTIVPIRDSLDEWYRLENGYAKRDALQPVLLKAEMPPAPNPPFWAEVGGAVAVVRQWCAADAPLVARIGHGGVAQVVDMLPGHVTWYALADEDAFIGWSQAAPWQPVAEIRNEIMDISVIIDTQTRQLDVLENDRIVMSAPIALRSPLTRGNYQIERGKRSVKIPTQQASIGYGAPWQMTLGIRTISGAYWHNEFGKPSAVAGADVQLTPPVASWLYHQLGNGTPVIVR